MQPCAAVTDAGERGRLVQPTATASTRVSAPASHLDIENLCHAVVGEMLLTDCDEGGPTSPASRLVKSASGVALPALGGGGAKSGSSADPPSPVGVCDAADVWSDLDPDSSSSGSSPRKGWRRAAGGGEDARGVLSVSLSGGGNGVSDMEVRPRSRSHHSNDTVSRRPTRARARSATSLAVAI
jgi:hypothetical protein